MSDKGSTNAISRVGWRNWSDINWEALQILSVTEYVKWLNAPATTAIKAAGGVASEALASTTEPTTTTDLSILKGCRLLATLPASLGAVLSIGMLPDGVVVCACAGGVCLVYSNGNTIIL